MKKFVFVIFVLMVFSGCQEKIHDIEFETGFEEIIEPMKINDGELLELPDIVREGHQFLGWFTSLSNDSPLYNELEPVRNSFTLYAKWRVNSYKIIYQSMGGTNIPEQTVLYGETIIEPNEPIKNGYKFLGWTLDENLNDIYEFHRMPGYDLILYAIWEEVTYTGSEPSDAIYVTLDTFYEVFIDLEESIVFRFQPTNSGTYTLESYGEFDTYVKVFQLLVPHEEPITWDDLYQIEAEDDFGENQNFKLSMEFNQTIVYFIQVEMFFPERDSGLVQFKIYP